VLGNLEKWADATAKPASWSPRSGGAGKTVWC